MEKIVLFQFRILTVGDCGIIFKFNIFFFLFVFYSNHPYPKFLESI